MVDLIVFVQNPLLVNCASSLKLLNGFLANYKMVSRRFELFISSGVKSWSQLEMFYWWVAFSVLGAVPRYKPPPQKKQVHRV